MSVPATRYNRARAGSLWLLSDLPPRLRGAGGPGSEAFAAEVEAYQLERGLVADGKLGPGTWRTLRAELALESKPEAEPAPPAISDLAVDTRAEAVERIRSGMKASRHVREAAGAFVDVLQGDFTRATALELYRAMRYDGEVVAAEIQRRGGKDAVRAYARKGRTAEQMRRSYSKRWHKWIRDDYRFGMGIHWTAGNGGAERAARYLLHTKPGRVSSNAFLDYDGSVFIVFPTFLDPETGDDELLYTAHGAHNPGCFGVDFASPGFLERAGGHWRNKYGGKLRDEVVAACGVVTLEDLELRSWESEPTPAVPWLLRKEAGRVWSVKHFLAPTWGQLAGLVVLGRIHSKLYGWTEKDLVVVGHYQRSDSRADPFFYPLAWVRAACLGAGLEEDLVRPGSWLARCNPADVQELTVDYRKEVRSLGW